MSLPALFSLPLMVCLSSQLVAALEQPKFALLDNGQVIEGRIEGGELNTVVIKPSGSRIVFDNHRIECVCDSLPEVYWQKCAKLRATDIDGHIQLFEWCLQHEQLAEAENQIELLQGMQIPANQLPVLNLKLADARAVREKKRLKQEYDSQYAITDLPATVDADSEIRLVGFESAANPAVHLSDRNKYLKQLDDTTDRLPVVSVITFKRRIEPLLIHSCFTAKCHDSNAAEMPLAIYGGERTVPKRLSQRNLVQVLRYADVNRPLESDLLKAAVLPHAGQARPLIKLGSPQFEILQQWLVGISASPFNYHQLPSQYFESETQVAESAVHNKLPELAPEMVGVSRLSKSDTDNNNRDQKTESPAPSEQDPFDPEIFNRKYLKKESDAENGDGLEGDE